MSRKSMDIYKRESGAMLSAPPGAPVPDDARLWEGYDYDKQEWVYEGRRNVRDIMGEQA